VVCCVMADQGGGGAKRASSERHASTGSFNGISRRVTDSASGLLRDTLSPNGTQPTSALAHVLASEDKAGPSTTTTETAGPGTGNEWRGGLNARQVGSSPGTEDTFRELATSGGSIISLSADSAKGLSLDEFTESAQKGTEVLPRQHSSTARGKQLPSSIDSFHTKYLALDAEMSAVRHAVIGSESSQASPKNSSVKPNGANGAYQVAEVNEADGADVLKLLQDPSAPFWTAMPDEEEKEEIPYTITQEDMRIAEEIIRCVGATTASKPDYDSMMTAAKHDEPFSKFSSFFDDIENYQNEVWGYLRPLIEEAKRQNMQPRSSVAKEGPATRRLRLILAHIDETR
jgi:hypothetical protein